VDHRVHPAEPVDLLGDVPRLVEVGQVSDDRHGPVIDEIAKSGETVLAARVHHELVTAVEQGLRGRSTEAIGGTGDEDAGYEVLPPGQAPSATELV